MKLNQWELYLLWLTGNLLYLRSWERMSFHHWRMLTEHLWILLPRPDGPYRHSTTAGHWLLEAASWMSRERLLLPDPGLKEPCHDFITWIQPLSAWTTLSTQLIDLYLQHKLHKELHYSSFIHTDTNITLYTHIKKKNNKDGWDEASSCLDQINMYVTCHSKKRVL